LELALGEGFAAIFAAGFADGLAAVFAAGLAEAFAAGFADGAAVGLAAIAVPVTRSAAAIARIDFFMDTPPFCR
jgi:hypothetical protein